MTQEEMNILVPKVLKEIGKAWQVGAPIYKTNMKKIKLTILFGLDTI